MEGRKEWEFSRKDIFTGACVVREGVVVVSDFNNEENLIDLELGRGRLAGTV